MKRIEWIDSMKFFAMVFVIIPHVVDKFYPALLSYWVTPPYRYLPFLIRAKLPVCMFCVLLGFFASRSKAFSFKSLFQYIAKRYVQFAFYILITSVVFVACSYISTWIFHTPDSAVYRVLCDGPRYNVIYLLRDSFLFESTYNDSLWVVQAFFIGSIACYLLSSFTRNLNLYVKFAITSLLVALLLLSGKDLLMWISFCIMGFYFRIYQEIDRKSSLLSNNAVKALLCIFAYAICKACDEGPLCFFFMSVASLIFLIVIDNSLNFQALLNRKTLSKLGSMSLGLFVVHTPVISIFYSTLFPFEEKVLSAAVYTFLFFVLTLVLSIVCAYILDKLYSYFKSLFSKQAVLVK